MSDALPRFVWVNGVVLAAEINVRIEWNIAEYLGRREEEIADDERGERRRSADTRRLAQVAAQPNGLQFFRSAQFANIGDGHGAGGILQCARRMIGRRRRR